VAGPRIKLPVPRPCRFASVARCGGSVKRSDNRRQVRIVHRFWRATHRVLCTRYAWAVPVSQSSLASFLFRRRADMSICFRNPPKLGILRMW
jgi:hypothetical protein